MAAAMAQNLIFLFISLLAQRNEPKKWHPGQGSQSSVDFQ